MVINFHMSNVVSIRSMVIIDKQLTPFLEPSRYFFHFFVVHVSCNDIPPNEKVDH